EAGKLQIRWTFIRFHFGTGSARDCNERTSTNLLERSACAGFRANAQSIEEPCPITVPMTRSVGMNPPPGRPSRERESAESLRLSPITHIVSAGTSTENSTAEAGSGA